jgi:hypothetical protein
VSASENDQITPNKFTRQSETQSLCTLCLATVKCATAGFLDIAEDVHSKFCPAKP